ncbi:hypothetical protein GCM10012275_48230 [Longimycelium tulufanense]|uniref:Protein-L-isoaspartate O-methyltransferase n=1 Tax=Longimycelium tulufanense TaxID=907463 RepID=A0A8J3FX63_9PSEU|nr:hypothetical protein GCM10012275_48230 [Longimycelium tulufanense]
MPQEGPVPPEVLRAVYSDEALVTRLGVDGWPASSASQPSVVARMLEALCLAPGMRVLEIGAGTGYNAALLAEIVGPQGWIRSVDVDASVVAGAQATLDRLGTSNAIVAHGDGYEGAPDHGPYDRIVCTVGIDGISPHWLRQLTSDGIILAPLGHAGFHPVMRCLRSGSDLRGEAVLWCDFMRARGSLCPRPDPLHFVNVQGTGGVVDRHAPVLASPSRYPDLWFFLGCRDQRARLLALRDHTGQEHWGCGLTDDRGAVLLGQDATYITGNSDLLDNALGLVRDWAATDRPELDEWRCQFAQDSTVLVPSNWVLAR